MKAALQDFSDVFIPQNNNLISLSNSEEWRDYQKFTIVRNPFDRIQSLQAMLKKLQGIDISIDEILDIVEDPSIGYNHFNGKVYIKRHALPMTHPHYQVWKDEKINVDRYWRLEDLSENIGEIKEFLNREELNIPIVNSTTKQKPKLTDSEIERIKKVYAQDFKAFYPETI